MRGGKLEQCSWLGLAILSEYKPRSTKYQDNRKESHMV